MKISLILIATILFVACNSTKQEETTDQIAQKKEIIQDGEYDELMQKIDDNMPNLVKIESLTYSKEDGSAVTATAYLDQNDIITKIEEEVISSGKYGAITRYHYYSNGGVLFATRRIGEKIQNNEPFFSEEISFYDPNGKVKESKERIAKYEEYLDNQEFNKAQPISHSNERALRILQQKGEFMTTFQGFVESGPYNFLIVGEHVPDNGYTAALSIQNEDATIRYLRAEGRNALGKELLVEFEKYIDPQGYRMQILKKVSLVERKEAKQ